MRPTRFDLSRAGCPTWHKHMAEVCTTNASRTPVRMYSRRTSLGLKHCLNQQNTLLVAELCRANAALSSPHQASTSFVTKLHHSSVGPVFRPTQSRSASLSQGRLLVPVSVVFQGRTTTIMRCTLHVCGSRRSSDGDVPPSQLVPSRERRHHINPRHIVIGVYLTVFPLARPLWSNSFQLSSPASVEPCRVSSVSMSIFWHARCGLGACLSSCHVRIICFLRHGVAVLVWQPFAIRRRAPLSSGDVSVHVARTLPPNVCQECSLLGHALSRPEFVCRDDLVCFQVEAH